MATFAFKPQYTYKPTPPRSKSTATRPKPAREQISILNKLQHIKSSGASLSTPRLAAVAVDDDGGYRPVFRGTGTVYGRSDKVNNDENDDDRDLPTIEKLLLTKLQEQGSTTEDRGPDKTGGVEGVASERGGSVDQSRSAHCDDLGGSPDDPIFLLGDDDSSASVAEADDVSLCAESTEPVAGLFDSPENAVDSTTPAPPCRSDGWHDIDDFPKTAPRLQLAEQGASTLKSIYPHTPSSRLSSEPLHESISTEGSHCVRSEATTSSSSRPPRYCRASPESQLNQEGRLYTGRGVVDEHGLFDPALDTYPIDEGAREQEVEQEKGECNSGGEDEGPQQEVNGVAPAVTAERVGDAHLSGKEDRSSRSAERQQSLPNRDPSPEPSQDGAGSDSHSDDELNNTDSDEDNEEPRPTKRKRPSSSHDGPMHKKRKHHLQQRSTRQHRPHSKPRRRSPKSHSPLDQGSTVAAVSSIKGRLLSPAPSTSHATNTDKSPDYCNLDRSSRAVLPTLTEVTFRPHSPHCCSFTAVIRDGCDRRGVSFSQVAQLIEGTGHVGKIDDFTIKPMEQHSFLLTGFSRHTSSKPSSGGETVSTAEVGRIHRNTTRSRPQDGRTFNAGAFASRSEPSSSDDDGGLSDSDSESSSDDDGCSSEDERRSHTSKHSRWSDLDEQRLLAYKKEDKSWDWIFGKFPGRTPAAVRTRWNMVRPRGE